MNQQIAEQARPILEKTTGYLHDCQAALVAAGFPMAASMELAKHWVHHTGPYMD